MKTWLKQLFSSSDNASMKRFSYFVVVISAIVWMSFDLYLNGLTDLWQTCFNTLIITVSSAYVGGKAVEQIGITKQDSPKSENVG